MNPSDGRPRTRTDLQRLLSLGSLTLLAACIGLLCGGASALFLVLLDLVTMTRVDDSWLVFLLPLGGLLTGLVYERWGASITGGTSRILEAVASGGPPVPLRMAPMVLFGTLVTHLFGGSAGREGTAVQMGGSLADQLTHRLGLNDPNLRRGALAAGIAGGFGAVFGTPFAGVVFAFELTRRDHRNLWPCLVAAIVGDLTTRSLGVGHSIFPPVDPLPLDLSLLLRSALFAVAVALTAITFIELTHRTKHRLISLVPRLPLRMTLGGLVIIGLTLLVGTEAYLGLGVPVIEASFTSEVPPESFALKLLFTSLTLSFGFLGGEVTPLFFIGATLGNLLASPLGLPLPLAAGVGMAAVFGAASKTPLALSIMAVELCGAAILPHVLLVTSLASLLSGRRSIYAAPHGHAPKH